MTEREIINKLRELGQISPQKDWLVLTKVRILGQDVKKSRFLTIFEVFPQNIFNYKSAMAAITVFVIFFGLFGFAQNSMPGDLLFSVKRITERSQAVFVSEADMPQVNLELATKRLEELIKIAEANQVRKLAPALGEFQASVSEATKSLSKLEATSSDPIALQKIVDKTKKIEERVEEVRSLGVIIGGEEISRLQGILELKLLIAELERKSLAEELTEEQEEILSQIKELVKKEKYPEAMELYSAEFENRELPKGEEEEITEELEEESKDQESVNLEEGLEEDLKQEKQAEN